MTETGSYYVEISAGNSHEDVTQSYPFEIQGDAGSGDATDSAPVDDGSQVAPQSVQPEAVQQEETSEPEENEEPPKKKLSLHNEQTKVAHISSHNDIDTVSEPSSSPAEEATPQQIPEMESQPKAQLQSEPLMPETSPSASIKDLMAADDTAVAEEKEWLAQQQKGPDSPHGRKKKTSPSQDQPKSQQNQPSKDKPTHKPVEKAPKKEAQKEAGKKTHKAAEKAASKDQPAIKIALPLSNKASTTTAKDKDNDGPDLKAQIKAKAKETAAKVKENAQKSNKEEVQRQKMSLAQQEALDDQAIREEMAQIKSSKAASPSKEKRDAYRRVMRNRARFAKQGLQ